MTPSELRRRAGRSRAILFVIALIVTACGPSAAPDTVIGAYEGALNGRDISAVMALYASFAVVTGHPTHQSDIQGSDEIREVESRRIAAAGTGDRIRFTDIAVSENVATFGHVAYDPDGVCSAGDGHRVVIDTGRIIRWDWGTHGDPCEGDTGD